MLAHRAAQTVENLILPALLGLAGPIRVGDHLAGHVADVSLAGGDDVLQHLGVGQTADGGDGDGNAGCAQGVADGGSQDRR